MLHFHCLAAKQGRTSSKQVNFCFYFVFSWIQIRCRAGHRKTKRKLKCEIRILSECKRWSRHLSGVLCGWVFFFPPRSSSPSVLEGEKRGKEGFLRGGTGCRSLPLSGGILNWPRQTAATTPDGVTMKRGHQGHDLSSAPDKRPVWTNLGLGLAPDTGPRSVWDARSPAASARLLKAEGF